MAVKDGKASSGCGCCCSCSCESFCSKTHLQKAVASNRTTPSGKSSWQWRTEKHQNCAQKLPSYFSYFFLLFPPSCFLLLLLLQASSKGSRLKSNHSQRQIPMAVKDGKAAKLALKLPNVTSETHRKEWFQLHFLLVSSCFLLLLLLVLLPAISSAQKGIFKRESPKIEPLPAANPHGSEGRKSIKIAPKTP